MHSPRPVGVRQPGKLFRVFFSLLGAQLRKGRKDHFRFIDQDAPEPAINRPLDFLIAHPPQSSTPHIEHFD
jgi:hypothetical protein